LVSPAHQAWLVGQAASLLGFFRPMVSSSGWFSELDDDSRPLPTGCPAAPEPQQNLMTVARAVHSFAAGEMLGVPGCAAVVDAGLCTLWEQHRDPSAGGYFGAVGHNGATDGTKSAYGHAFVLLGAATALAAGHDASALFTDVLGVIDEHFWSDEEGAAREAFDRGWHELEAYRGANSNMHLTESFLAAADAGDRPDLAERAARVASKLIDGHARGNGWLLPEHYDPHWRPRLGYNRDRPDDPFRPYGATVGHSIEWARLVASAGMAAGSLDGGQSLAAAEALFARAVDVGWDKVHGGLAYTVDWDGGRANPDHYWWPVAEAIGTSSYLLRLTGNKMYETWYRRFWDHASDVLIDHRRGGWYPLFDADNRHKVFPWYGKPDIYHALQACLLPVLPLASSLAGAIRAAWE
jgi:mannose/cellobiose epimerase-like protein (N-acyl-D-glucosamine 2-epimerase family)